MRIFVLFALAISAISVSPHANADPVRRFNIIEVDNYGANNPRFEMTQEFASCAKPVAGKEKFTLERGWNEKYRYYELLSEDSCFYETKELRWLVTASRQEDNFRWQCRMRLTNRFDAEIRWFRTKVEIEPVEPVAPGASDLCTDGTLFKSAICESSDKASWERANCLNQDSDMHGNITIKLGGPPLPPAPASWSVNPLTTSAPQ
ncbi:hypothetical protein [Trinickia sp. EG282A]|uniref:hypothetical protein n=1 Tax=Trinickia sp. EG282A TaxID=3237013 RepID=UPI0034D18C57